MGNSKPECLVWMDLEMTGLEPEVDEIIEIATVVTDNQLEVLEIGPSLILHQPASRFDRMDDWNKNQHTKTGLWEQVLTSEITAASAEKDTLKFIKRFIKQPKTAPLCGNSIWQDRRFIRKYMPDLDAFLHYRMIDVSTIKELSARWYADMTYGEKGLSHRAQDDILDSINELKFYRKNVFK